MPGLVTVRFVFSVIENCMFCSGYSTKASVKKIYHPLRLLIYSVFVVVIRCY
jgi:hypothetical protein